MTPMAALPSFLAGGLSPRLGVRMHRAGRDRGVLRRQLLDLSLQLIDAMKQRQERRFDGRGHLGFQLGRYSARADIRPENRSPCLDRFANSWHRAVNGYRPAVLLRPSKIDARLPSRGLQPDSKTKFRRKK